ncbi:permease [Clostridium magnum]|uniref:Putative permease n=1 Tax=Clostridium magnum DSM 2767 TaxID=1121326 RepID=A0A162SW42_9CLOT|nr:permease [Clostridium magnum]KZL91940.1 putative permease [Clostridium magnum DSM 2767]SHH29039.1 Predicted permease [Clostridium magnum DSM 2767]
MGNYILYGITIILLIISYHKDKKKTKMALKKAWKAFENILPEFLTVIMFVGVLLAILNPEVISKIIGNNSGYFGVVIAAIVGAVTLIPGFVAFPTAAMLLQNGAGTMQIGAFLSTLMMVGIVTMPVEIKYFGKKLTVLRNVFAFIFSFLVAYIIGKVV